MSGLDLLDIILRAGIRQFFRLTIFSFQLSVFVAFYLSRKTRALSTRLWRHLESRAVAQPNGDVFLAEHNHSRGQALMGVTYRRLYFYKGMKYMGASMVSFAAVILLISYGPVVEQYFIADRPKKIEVRASEAVAPVETNSSIESEQIQEIIPSVPSVVASDFGVSPEFSIVIPSIDAKSNIVPNVDAGNREEYLPAILEGVGHAYGTSVPGEPGTTYLFAHSTNSPFYIEQFNAVFYLLKDVETDDTIYVFYDGGTYEYKVIETVVVGVSDTNYLVSNDPAPRIVLQTSHPPGTTWKRLLVVAEPKF